MSVYKRKGPADKESYRPVSILPLLSKVYEKVLYGDIWTRNRQKIAQIEVFGHFLDFASLVFLDFGHNDRWAWCLVVFLQFSGPVNVFLFDNKYNVMNVIFEKWWT